MKRIIITFVQKLAFLNYHNMTNGPQKMINNSNFSQTCIIIIITKYAYKNNNQSYEVMFSMTTILQT